MPQSTFFSLYTHCKMTQFFSPLKRWLLKSLDGQHCPISPNTHPHHFNLDTLTIYGNDHFVQAADICSHRFSKCIHTHICSQETCPSHQRSWQDAPRNIVILHIEMYVLKYMLLSLGKQRRVVLINSVPYKSTHYQQNRIKLALHPRSGSEKKKLYFKARYIVPTKCKPMTSSDIYFGNVTQIKITHFAFKKGFWIDHINGTLFIPSMPVHTKLVFNRKSHRLELFQCSLEENKLSVKVGSIPCLFFS